MKVLISNFQSRIPIESHIPSDLVRGLIVGLNPACVEGTEGAVSR